MNIMVKPPPKRKSRKGAPPPELSASTNLHTSDPDDLKPLNFKVPATFRKEYKSYATDNDMTMVELLQRSFELYKKNKQ